MEVVIEVLIVVVVVAVAVALVRGNNSKVVSALEDCIRLRFKYETLQV